MRTTSEETSLKPMQSNLGSARSSFSLRSSFPYLLQVLSIIGTHPLLFRFRAVADLGADLHLATCFPPL